MLDRPVQHVSWEELDMGQGEQLENQMRRMGQLRDDVQEENLPSFSTRCCN